MLWRPRGVDFFGETIMVCYGLVRAPRVKDDEDGHLDVCPLVEANK